MTIIKNYNYSEKEISTFIVDTTNEKLWIAFESDGSNCVLKKVSSNDPLQVYFDIDVPVTEIKKLFISGTYIYLAYNDATYIGARKSLANPTITYTNISLPAGIVEAPVDIIVGSLGVFFLIPGNDSGTNAKVVKFSITGVYDQTIDLSTIRNAKSITVDSNDDLWVVTTSSPLEYVRVFLDGTWQFQSFT